MRLQRYLVLGLVAAGLGCDGTMNTGTVKRPVNNKPAADGSCPAGKSLCGTGVFAICADLQRDPSHCGTCDRTCTPGIACQVGVCQQTVCGGTDIPFSVQPPAVTATPITINGVPSSAVNPPTIPTSTILADVNGDRRLDLVSWSAAGACPACGSDFSTFRVSLAEANGTFAPPDTYRADLQIQRIFTADVNGDGMADLYVVSSTFSNSVVSPYSVDLWLGQKDGHLQKSDAAGIQGKTIDSSAGESAIGDLSGDGWPDLVMVGPKLDYDAPPEISVYLSDATGALHLSQTFVAWSNLTLVRDMDRDGSPDILLFSETLEILFNRGDGTFQQPVDCGFSLGAGGWGAWTVVEDFNRDGWMDLAEDEMRFAGGLSSPPQIGVMLGQGGCGFSPISFYVVPGTSGSAGSIRAADMNGDGILDLVSVHAVMVSDPKNPTGVLLTTDNVLGVLIGKGDGTFQLQGTVVSLGPTSITAVAIGAVSGDQRPDVVISSTDPQTVKTSIVENTCL